MIKNTQLTINDLPADVVAQMKKRHPGRTSDADIATKEKPGSKSL